MAKYKRDIQFKVVGKDKHRGWFGPKYYVALQLTDPHAGKKDLGKTQTFTADLGLYSYLEIGQQYTFPMYSNNQINWYFKPELATERER